MPLIPTVLAHEVGDVVEVVGPTLTETVRHNQINLTLATAAILFTLTVLAILMSKARQKTSPAITSAPTTVSPPTTTPAEQPVASTVTPPVPVPASSVPAPTQPAPADGSEAGSVEENAGAWWKTAIFTGMVLVILANTAYLVGSTLYVNAKSVTNGPVHWHADFEVWDCGSEIELVDPKPPSNKVGSPLLHEHNDKEIHVEEAVFDSKDISLSAFFKVVGGDLHSDYLKMPANQGIVERRNTDLCPNGTPGVLRIFLYKAGSFEQQIMEDPENYLMTPEQKVPPGDCIIIEFGPPKEKTEHLCQKYEVAKEKIERGR